MIAKKYAKYANVEQLEHVNQFIITFNDGSRIFQSYWSVVAIQPAEGKLILGRDWHYSNTTLRHLYLFLKYYNYYSVYSKIEKAKNKKQAINELIKNGEIIYDETLF